MALADGDLTGGRIVFSLTAHVLYRVTLYCCVLYFDSTLRTEQTRRLSGTIRTVGLRAGSKRVE